MKICQSIREIRNEVKDCRRKNKSIGFVPTMGYLHEGHLSLIKEARDENDVVVVSIFVNPTQFGPGEDLESYPRDLDRDSKLVENVGADFLFIPSVPEMYPKGYETFVEVEGDITKRLCGKSREGHFKGVTSVVSKLFNIVKPDKAYFGQKDAQQVAVIEKMVRDLNFDIDIIPCPIVREDDGLALSSRNSYLDPRQRKDATILYKSLSKAKEMIENGEKDAETVKNFIINTIKTVEYAEIDYVDIVSAETLESINTLKGDVLVAIAVKIGKPRLIDNIRLEVL